MSEDAQFYVSQKAVIIKDGKILVMHDPEFGSDLPGGKIKAGELDFTEELKREVREETGLEIAVGNPFATGYFELPITSKNKNAGRKIFNVYYACTYISGEVKLSDEHDSYTWVSKDTLKDIVNQEQECNVIAKYFVLFTNQYVDKQREKRHRLLSE